MTHPIEAATGFDIETVRKDFPILSRTVNGKPLVYLDSAATAQKPRQVIDAISHYYSHYNANVHRGLHTLSEEATVAYEGAREKVRAFINAEKECEIIFTKGTTDGINLVAQSYARPRLKAGDEVIVSRLEHHSNIVPWQLVCEQTGATLKVIDINDRGEMDQESYHQLLSDRTRIVAINHVSNALGTINPVEDMIEKAHAAGAVVLLDGAQAVPHGTVDVQALDCDFYAFSGHKMMAPTGIGILYGKASIMEDMPPYQGGGDMIKTVSFEKTVYADLPSRFEAGTPNIAGAIGLGAAVDYLTQLGMDQISAHEQELLAYGTEKLQAYPGLSLVGTAANKAAVLSFTMDDAHPHDVGTILSNHGLAVRTGHHCAQPIMDFFGIPATTRASLAFYNTREDIDILIEGLDKVRKIFGLNA